MKKQVLIWLSRFGTCCFLDNSEYPVEGAHYECLAAAGESARVVVGAGKAFDTLRHFSDAHHDWLFGHFSFELKAETDGVTDELPGTVVFPDCFFFVPETVVILDRDAVRIGTLGAPDESRQTEIYREILLAQPVLAKPLSPVTVRERMSRGEYLAAIRQLQLHIRRGDCYEINYCQEFFAEDAALDPISFFAKLSAASPAPFAAFYRLEEKYLLCASPERYLRRAGSRVYSQPIKGTSARYPENPREDIRSKTALAASEKDRAENVMIADLVRNDLSRFCIPDTVRVDELFGIYSFAQVHQMITSISGQVQPDLDWTEMIRASFPMASMTGAPKKKVLELIARYEYSKRGLFSGALGYVTPERDFDFNVVIRSLLYDARRRRLSWFAGSGITAASDAESEYAECLVKVRAIRNLFSPL